MIQGVRQGAFKGGCILDLCDTTLANTRTSIISGEGNVSFPKPAECRNLLRQEVALNHPLKSSRSGHGFQILCHSESFVEGDLQPVATLPDILN